MRMTDVRKKNLAGCLFFIIGYLIFGICAGAAAELLTYSSGTGFFVSRDGFLVTSAHVIAGCASISAWPSDGTERPSYVIASNQRLDLALLWADGAPARPTSVSCSQPPRTCSIT